MKQLKNIHQQCANSIFNELEKAQAAMDVVEPGNYLLQVICEVRIISHDDSESLPAVMFVKGQRGTLAEACGDILNAVATGEAISQPDCGHPACDILMLSCEGNQPEELSLINGLSVN